VSSEGTTGSKNGKAKARSQRRKLAAVRFGMRALSAVAPPLAARVALKLFRTPRRHVPWDGEREIMERARSVRIDVRGRPIAAWTWGSGTPVLLVHGWGSAAGRLASFVEPLVASGLSVVAFDAPGHGATEGPRQSSLPEFMFAIEAAASEFGPFAGVVAHSLGGAATTLAMARAVPIARAVLLAPSSNPAGYTRQFAEIVGIPAGIRERMEAFVERHFGIPWSEFDVLAAARRITVPALVFHDRGDAEVVWSEGAALAESWPGAELVTMSGVGHTRIVHDPAVVDGAIRFLSTGRGAAAADPLSAAGSSYPI
jgi:pimeloyl-ACP methyl ester carboxylesterase